MNWREATLQTIYLETGVNQNGYNGRLTLTQKNLNTNLTIVDLEQKNENTKELKNSSKMEVIK